MVGSDGMNGHPAAEGLEAALQFEVQQRRQAAADEINPIDRRRAQLVAHLDPDPGGTTSPSGPVVPRRRAEQELAVLDLEREQRNGALVRETEQLIATAQRADNAYRQGYQEDSPAGRLLEPIEFKLPIEDTGPIPDPVRPVAP